MEDEATRVWNRATTDAVPMHEGDRALKSALFVHGQIMNGGLLSALDYIDYHDLRRGGDGLEYLGLRHAAAAVRDAVELAFPDGPVTDQERHTMTLPEEALERIEGELEDAYGVDDEVLYDAFLRRFQAQREDFAPATG